jgi:hypothetical protein
MYHTVHILGEAYGVTWVGMRGKGSDQQKPLTLILSPKGRGEIPSPQGEKVG